MPHMHRGIILIPLQLAETQPVGLQTALSDGMYMERPTGIPRKNSPVQMINKAFAAKKSVGVD